MPGPAIHPSRLVYYTGFTRIVVGGAALVTFWFITPAVRPHVGVLVAYLAFACLEQWLIRRNIGGRTRTFIAGVVDGFVVTYYAHRLGSVGSAISALYMLPAVLSVLVVGRRVGVAIGCVHALMFNAVVWLEWLGVLPFAPDEPALASLGAPPWSLCVVASVVITTVIVGSTATVGALVTRLGLRERELEAANARLAELSHADPLTGLANRRRLFDVMESALSRMRGGKGLAVVMVDLDGFKRINDTQGHLRGDVLLVEIAEAVRQYVRATDVPGRYGGDELMIVLPEATQDNAIQVAERVTEAIAFVGRKFDATQPVTASVGIAMGREGDSVASLTRRADENCYSAKKLGGNRVVA